MGNAASSSRNNKKITINMIDLLPCEVLDKIMAYVGPYRHFAGTSRSFRDAYTRQYPLGKLGMFLPMSQDGGGSVLGEVLDFVGPGHYRYIAASCRGFRDAYKHHYLDNFVTSRESIVGCVKNAELYESEILHSSMNQQRLYYGLALSAARYGQLDTLKWASARHHDITKRKGNNEPSSFTPEQKNQICDKAAEGGHVECFNYLHEAGSSIIEERYLITAVSNGRTCFLTHFHENCAVRFTSPAITLAAARNGSDFLLKWLVTEWQCPWSSAACYKAAARAGHLNCLDALYRLNRVNIGFREHGVGVHGSDGGTEITTSALTAAASGGHLQCLGFVFSRLDVKYGGDWAGDVKQYGLKNALREAAECGHVWCLAFLLQRENIRWEDSDYKMVLNSSSRNGNLDCLRYLVEDELLAGGIQHDEDEWDIMDFLECALLGAADSGKLNCLGYLLDLDHDDIARSWRSLAIHNAVERTVYFAVHQTRLHERPVYFESAECLSRLLLVPGVDWDHDLLSRLLEDAEENEWLGMECSRRLGEFLNA